MKICIECKHLVLDEKCFVGGTATVVYHRCALTHSLVTGKPLMCDDERSSGKCGELGVNYEPAIRHERTGRGD